MSAQTEAPGLSLLKPVRNQLGVIALLIFLIYALASSVIGFSGHIEPAQKWPLVWFLVVFPLLVLGTFGWLLSRHHGKLVVAGTEAFSGEMFLSTLTPDQQRRKLSKDLHAFEAASGDIEVNGVEAVYHISFIAADFDGRAVYILAVYLVLRPIRLDP